MTGPRVTIGIATWNRAHLLGETIQAVLSQSLRDLELYVCDDASTDHTAELVHSFEDERVHFLPSVERLGLNGNLTRALTSGSAPYVVVCQDDDVLLPDNLQRLVSVLEDHPEVGLAHGAFHIINEHSKIIKENVNWFGADRTTIESGEVFIRKSMGGGNRINMTSAMFRRSAIQGLAFDQEDGIGTDLGFWLRVARRSDIAFVAEPLTLWRYHQGSTSKREGLHGAGAEMDLLTMEQIRILQDVKQRFLREHGYEGETRRDFERRAHRWARRELLNSITRRTRPARQFSETWPLFRDAARIEPSLWRSPKSARVLAASLAGRRARQLTNRLRTARP